MREKDEKNTWAQQGINQKIIVAVDENDIWHLTFDMRIILVSKREIFQMTDIQTQVVTVVNVAAQSNNSMSSNGIK